MEIGLGLGASTLISNVEFSFVDEPEPVDRDQNVTTLLFMPGIQYRIKPSENTQLTIGAALHYAPYRIKGAIDENIGGMAISPRINYSF